jgi:hypothetical protein
VKVNPLGVEAYRQSGAMSKRGDSPNKAVSDSAQSPHNIQITRPGGMTSAVNAVQTKASPSLLAGILSSEEKDLLVKHFARFGDKAAEGPTYSASTRINAPVVTGLKVDVKG